MADKMMEISALSRPLHLGTLYDARNDTLVPGLTLWSNEDIKKHVNVESQPNTKIQISASDSLSEKSNLLDVSASVKASFFCGLVEVGGSAKYLKETTSSTRQCRVTLQYHVSTVFKQLMVSDLKIQNPEVLNKTNATHVVTGVLYGADALMEFQDMVTDESKKMQVQGNLSVMIKKIPTIEISGEGKLNMNDEEKNKVQNFSCRFYGDFQLKNNPSSYEEAVKVYKELPTMLGEKNERAVPVKVWLLPLKKLVDTAARIKNSLSENAVCLMEKMMDDFHEVKIKTNDMIEKSKAIKANDITTKLEEFQKSLRVFSTEILQKMAEILPAIREGTAEESSLAEVINSKEISGFSSKDMLGWLDEKETELNIVKSYIGKINTEIKSPGTELNTLIMDPDISDVYVFSFTSLQYEEPYLQKISKTGCKAIQKTPGESPWYQIPSVKQYMQSALKVFKDCPPACKVISYISDPKHPGASVRQYQNGTLKDSNTAEFSIKKYALDLTIDRMTANPFMHVSDVTKTMTRVNSAQDHPNTPETFDTWKQVLCKESVTERGYWEVEWKGWVIIAVSYKSIVRKGERTGSQLEASEKAWCLQCRDFGHMVHYSVYHNQSQTELAVPSSERPKIGVFVDKTAGKVSFYAVTSEKLTHWFTYSATFTEPLYPAFGIHEDGSSVTILSVK